MLIAGPESDVGAVGTREGRLAKSARVVRGRREAVVGGRICSNVLFEGSPGPVLCIRGVEGEVVFGAPGVGLSTFLPEAGAVTVVGWMGT